MSLLYEHLTSFGFTKPDRAEQVCAKKGLGRIRDLLEQYSEAVATATFPQVGHAGAIRIFPDSWAGPLPGRLVRQLSLYADVIYLHDPLLDSARELREQDLSPVSLILTPDQEERTSRFIQRLAKTIDSLIRLKPLVEAGVVQFLPSQLLAVAKEPGTLYTTDFYGPGLGRTWAFKDKEDPLNEFPEALVRHALERVQVIPVELREDGYVLGSTAELTPQRVVGVSFEGDSNVKVFTLFETRAKSDSSGVVEMSFNLKRPAPIDRGTFSNWVAGCSQEIVLERMISLGRDLFLAASTGANFLTSLPVSRDLVSMNLQSANSPQPVQALLQLELPYFENVTAKELATARKNEAAFGEFRRELHKALVEVAQLRGSDARARAEEVVRDQLLVPVARIEKRMRSLQRNIFLDRLLLLGSLTATAASGGESIVTAAALVASQKLLESYKVHASQRDELQETPSYFYWQATKRARGR